MKIKTKFLLVAIIAISISFLPGKVSADTYGDLKYEIDSKTNEITITGLNNSDLYDEITEVTIPEEINGYIVTTIGEYTFEECRNLTSIKMPNTIKSIGSGAFYNCKNLLDIELSKNLINIENDSFANCDNLNSIEIPESVTSIGMGAFINCKSLSSIKVLGNNVSYISENGILFDKEKTKIICYPAGKKDILEYKIPENIKSLEYGAFWGCTSLTSIKIPNTITDLGRYTFSWCSGLENIEIPTSITNIGDGVFWKCTNLTNIKIPDTITEIGNNVFESCEKLNNIKIPNSVTNIGETTFANCINLEEVELSNNIKMLKGEIFSNCIKLKNIELPKNIISIDSNAFGEIVEGRIEPTLIVYKNSYAEQYAKNNNFDYKYKLVIDDLIVLGISDTIYTGREIQQSIVVKDNNTILEEGKDYVIEYKNNINVGKATVIIIGKGNYTGTKNITFNITEKKPTSIETVKVSNIENQIYTGNTIIPIIIVKDNNKTLKEETDYTIKYRNNVNVGTATVIITGKGNYTGNKTITFKIIERTIASVEISNVKNQIYTGNAIIPSIMVKDSNKILEEGKDYTLEYRNNINIGTATVIIIGKGNYIGTVTKTFNIVSKNISKTSIKLAYTKKEYTGKTLKPKVTIKDGTKTLKLNKDYTVTYKSNKNIGKATIIIKGKGNYNGTITKTFKIIPKKNKVTLKTSVRQIKVSWKKDKTVTGYVIECSTDKNFKKSKTVQIKKYKTINTTIKKLKSGKNYYVRIKSYKTIKNVKYYSSYSKVIKIKVK